MSFSRDSVQYRDGRLVLRSPSFTIHYMILFSSILVVFCVVATIFNGAIGPADLGKAIGVGLILVVPLILISIISSRPDLATEFDTAARIASVQHRSLFGRTSVQTIPFDQIASLDRVTVKGIEADGVILELCCIDGTRHAITHADLDHDKWGEAARVIGKATGFKIQSIERAER